MTLANILINRLRIFKENIIKAVPTPNNETPLSDVNNGNKGESPNYARSDHQHPLSNAYATSGHTHNNMEVTTNKSSSITTDTGSTTKYPTVKAVEDYVKAETDNLIGDLEEDMLS